MYTWLPLASAADLAALGAEISAEYDPQRVVKKLTAGLSSAVKAVLIERTTSTKTIEAPTTIFTQKRASTIAQTVSASISSIRQSHLKRQRLNWPVLEDRLDDPLFRLHGASADWHRDDWT